MILQRRDAWGIWAQLLFEWMWEKPWPFPWDSYNRSIGDREDRGGGESRLSRAICHLAALGACSPKQTRACHHPQAWPSPSSPVLLTSPRPAPACSSTNLPQTLVAFLTTLGKGDPEEEDGVTASPMAQPKGGGRVLCDSVH